MKKLKKILAAFLLVFAIGGLTACSQMNKVTTNFEEQGYVRYKYKNTGDSILFRVHDDFQNEEILRLLVDLTSEGQTTITETTVTTNTTDTSVAGPDNSDTYYGFVSYGFSNDDYAVVVMEFESEDFLAERLADSAVLQAAVAGRDAEDYINGNCLLIVLDDYSDNYENFAQIFQGLLDPIEA